MKHPKLQKVFTVALFILLIGLFVYFRSGYFGFTASPRQNMAVDSTHWVNKLSTFKLEPEYKYFIYKIASDSFVHIYPNAVSETSVATEEFLMSGSKSMRVVTPSWLTKALQGKKQDTIMVIREKDQ